MFRRTRQAEAELQEQRQQFEGLGTAYAAWHMEDATPAVTRDLASAGGGRDTKGKEGGGDSRAEDSPPAHAWPPDLKQGTSWALKKVS